MRPPISLTTSDRAHAKNVARSRTTWVRKNLPDCDVSEGQHYFGASGETAFAKLMHLPLDQMYTDGPRADYDFISRDGKTYEVKSTFNFIGDLLVQEERQTDYFFLMTPVCPEPEFDGEWSWRCIGWCDRHFLRTAENFVVRNGRLLFRANVLLANRQLPPWR